MHGWQQVRTWGRMGSMGSIEVHGDAWSTYIESSCTCLQRQVTALVWFVQFDERKSDLSLSQNKSLSRTTTWALLGSKICLRALFGSEICLFGSEMTILFGV